MRGFALTGFLAIVAIVLAGGSAFYIAQKDSPLGAVTELTDTINTFRTNVNATDEALRSSTSSDPGHTHTLDVGVGTILSASTTDLMVSGTLQVATTHASNTTVFGLNWTNATGTGLVFTNATGTSLEVTNITSGAINGTSTEFTVTNLRATNFALTNFLSVAEGGTGTSTLTAGAILLGSSTDALGEIPVGANGQFLASDGGSWQATTTSFGQATFIPSAASSTPVFNGAVSSTAAGEKSVASTTVAGGTIGVNDFVKLVGVFKNADAGNNCRVNIKFGSTVVATSSVGSTAGDTAYLEAEVWMLGAASSQAYSGLSWRSGTGGPNDQLDSSIVGIMTENTAANVVVDYRANKDGGTAECGAIYTLVEIKQR